MSSLRRGEGRSGNRSRNRFFDVENWTGAEVLGGFEDEPYDENFYKVIARVCEDLFKEFSPLFVYTFSDEISILLDRVPFEGRVEKINSIFASFTSSSFVMHYNIEFKKPPAFDSRIIPINENDILKYFK